MAHGENHVASILDNPSAQFVPHPASKIGNHNHDAASVPPAVKIDTPLDALSAVCAELDRAAKWGGFTSAHQAFAHIHEEFDELKEHVWTKQKNRDLVAMRAEAVQVAAMAIKFVQMIDDGRGRV